MNPYRFLLSSQGRVAAYFLEHPDATMNEAARALGLTERAVALLVHKLSLVGYLQSTRNGRGAVKKVLLPKRTQQALKELS